MIKVIIRNILPFYNSYLKCVSTKIHNLTYFKYIKFRMFGRFHQLYYPVHKNCIISNPRKVKVGINSSIARPGCYIQGAGEIYIGDYVRVAPNVGILSTNHDVYDHNKCIARPVKIGDYSWIGMNSTIMAGVELGPRTIVAAGAVVTKSFPEGFCIVAGVPAKKIRDLDRELFKPWKYENEFYGFIPKEEFEKNTKKWLDI